MLFAHRVRNSFVGSPRERLVNALNLKLLALIAAGDSPNPWVLMAGSSLAQYGSWVCVALVLWAAWRSPSDRMFVFAAMLAAVGVSVASHEIATLLGVHRPFVQGLVPAYVAHRTSASLPSTHASVMFFVAFVFLLRRGLRLSGLAIFVLAAATAWARIYVGLHFPLDIAAGGLLAAVSGALFMIGFTSLMRQRCATVAGCDRPARETEGSP
jgi:membrane-associated phospholipid phosphatase